MSLALAVLSGEAPSPRQKGLPFAGCAAWLVLAVGTVSAENKTATPSTARVAMQIHQLAVDKLPKQYQDLSQWGKTIAVIQRKNGKDGTRAGDRREVPNGLWKRTLLRILNPEDDLSLKVTEIKKINKNTTRVSMDATVVVHGEREYQEWAKGIRLLAMTAEGDGVVGVLLDVDATVAFDLANPLAGLQVSVKIPRLELDLKEFTLSRVNHVKIPEKQGILGRELKAALQARLKALEPKIREHAERLIIKEVRSGKGHLAR